MDTSRRSSGGRTVATFYDLCNEIWSGCPATTSIENALDAGDMQGTTSDAQKVPGDEGEEMCNEDVTNAEVESDKAAEIDVQNQNETAGEATEEASLSTSRTSETAN